MASNLLPLNLVEGVLAKTRAILFVSLFYLFVNSTLHADTCTVIEITCFRALEPNIFSICCLLGHCSNLWSTSSLWELENPTPTRRSFYSMIFVTTPDPTVRPPSRIANRRPSSMAIGLSSRSIAIFTLSPGMHISAPPSRSNLPVTSVVRK